MSEHNTKYFKSQGQRLNSIANWIGLALEGRMHGFNVRPHASSTIKVEQTKSKFDTVRVYCNLADELLVRELWESENPGKIVPEQFKRSCLKHDRQHFRTVHMEARDFWPDEWDSILRGSDHRELCYISPEEVEARIVNYCDRTTLTGPDFVHSARRFYDSSIEVFPDIGWDVTLFPDFRTIVEKSGRLEDLKWIS